MTFPTHPGRLAHDPSNPAYAGPWLEPVRGRQWQFNATSNRWSRVEGGGGATAPRLLSAAAVNPTVTGQLLSGNGSVPDGSGGQLAATGMLIPVTVTPTVGTLVGEWSTDGLISGAGDRSLLAQTALITPADATLLEIAPYADYTHSSTAASASQVSVLDAAGNQTVIYYKRSSTAWALVGGGLTNRETTVIPAGSRISVITRKTDTSFIGGLGDVWENAADASFLWFLKVQSGGVQRGYYTGVGATPAAIVWTPQGTATGTPVVTPVIAGDVPAAPGEFARLPGVNGAPARWWFADTATSWRELPASAVGSNISGITGAAPVTNMVALTQAQYAAITVPDPSTYYVITDAPEFNLTTMLSLLGVLAKADAATALTDLGSGAIYYNTALAKLAVTP